MSDHSTSTRCINNRHGYTLVEIIIVALLLGVLMSGVWSMFQMQNRMILQGQRLSRESSAVRTAWQTFRTDVSRICLPAIETPRNLGPRKPSINSDGETPSMAGLTFSSADRETAKPATFLFEGGSDWFVFDAYRPWQQLPAVTPIADADSASANFESTADTSQFGSLSQQISIPTNQTPFQRICYAWISSEEILQWTNLDVQSTQSDSENAEDETSIATRDNPSSGTTLSDTTLSDTTETPKRWFVRITCDWSVGSPDDSSVETSAETTDVPSIDSESSGLVEEVNFGDTRKQEWLQWLVTGSQSDYLTFQQWIGTIAEVDAGNDARELETETAERSISWTSHDGRIQIDWLPTVTNGQFRYLIDESWHDHVDSELRWDRKGIRAVELQYDVDPNHTPELVESPASNSLPASDLQDLPSFDSLDDETTTWSEALDNSTVLDPVPLHDYVCLVSIGQTDLDQQQRPTSPQPNRETSGTGTDESALELDFSESEVQ